MAGADLAFEALVLERAGRHGPLAWRVAAAGPGGSGPAEPLATVAPAGRGFAVRSTGGEGLCEVDGGRPVEIGRRYDVRAAGERVAVIEHRSRASLLRATWGLLHGREEHVVAWAREDAVWTALRRRLAGWVGPGRLAMPMGFTFLIGQAEVGRLTTLPGEPDRYLLDLAGDRGREIDRRAALALALLLGSGR
jgi:hypothetical protein